MNDLDREFDFSVVDSGLGQSSGVCLGVFALSSYLKVLVLVFFVFLTACGGGSSGGVGGGPTQFSGMYSGSETITVTFLGETTTGSGALTITISSDGKVTVRDTDGRTYVGNIKDVSFTATGSHKNITDPSFPGVTCSIEQTYVGTVNGNTITGTTSGSFTCNQAGSNLTATFSGTFTAALVG